MNEDADVPPPPERSGVEPAPAAPPLGDSAPPAPQWLPLTPGDRHESAALAVVALPLFAFPVITWVDRMAEGWRPLGLAAAGVGVVILWMAIRPVLNPAPALRLRDSAGVAALAPPLPEVPLALRFADGRSRMRAHLLRSAVLLLLAVLLAVDIPGAQWVFGPLVLAAFLADSLWMRPHRHIVDAEGVRPDSGLGGLTLRWSELRVVHWRQGERRQPLGERVVFECDGARAAEVVFVAGAASSTAEELVRAVIAAAPTLEVRIWEAKAERPSRPPGEATSRPSEVAQALRDSEASVERPDTLASAEATASPGTP